MHVLQRRQRPDLGHCLRLRGMRFFVQLPIGPASHAGATAGLDGFGQVHPQPAPLATKLKCVCVCEGSQKKRIVVSLKL